MSKDETPSSGGGLLSKVARFVRNPTVNWSELDSIQDDKESQYSKQMLKEMIERKLLKKIEQSISRIDAGDYGYCDETGEPIGVGRLLARPTATLSLEAQQRRELKQKMFGD